MLVVITTAVVIITIAAPAVAAPRERRDLRRPEPRREVILREPVARPPMRREAPAREGVRDGAGIRRESRPSFPAPGISPRPPAVSAQSRVPRIGTPTAPAPTTESPSALPVQRPPTAPAAAPSAPAAAPLAPAPAPAPVAPAAAPVVPAPAPAPVVVYPNVTPRPMILTQAPSFGVGSGGVRVGGSVAPSGDVIRDSVINGAVLGSAGGPIGAAIGAGVGLLHGLWAKRQVEKAARVESDKQKQADRKIEEELAAQKPGSSTSDPGTAVASLPPTAEAAEPPRDRLDPDGFRPVYEGGRLVRRERIAADGSVTEVLHYDTKAQIVRRDESSRRDGRFDTSTFYADGKPQRRESDTDGDGSVDLWATYDAGGDVARLETLADGKRHTQVYVAGKVSEEAWRRATDGVVTKRVKYEDGAVREKLDGNFLTYFEPNGAIAREAELGADGRPTMIAYYEGGRLVRRELYEIDDKAFERVPLAEVTR